MHILMVYHKVGRLNLQRLPLDIFLKFACAFSPNFLIKMFAILLIKEAHATHADKEKTLHSSFSNPISC